MLKKPWSCFVIFLLIAHVPFTASADGFSAKADLTLSFQASQNAPKKICPSSFAPCSSMMLCNGQEGEIEIRNNSSDTIALQIDAFVPASWGVTKTRTNCDAVNPGDICSIKFMVNTVTEHRADIDIYGTNTKTILLDLHLNDPLNC